MKSGYKLKTFDSVLESAQASIVSCAEKDDTVKHRHWLWLWKTSDKIDDLGLKVKNHGSWFWKICEKIDNLGESRGIVRQPEDMRGKGDLRQYIGLTVLWLGSTCSLPSMTGFFIGPLGFDLGFKDAMSAGLVGALVGSFVAAYGATMGPRMGLRQMISARFQFGWYPAKFIAFLNVLTLLGWAVVSSVFGGELLRAISNDTVPIDVGITIIFVVALVVGVFGVRILIWFDRIVTFFIWIAFLLCYVCTGPQYAVHSASVGNSETIQGHWVSFFSASIGVTSTWVALASDYHLDLPADSKPWKIFTFALMIIFLSTAFVAIPAIGISTAARFKVREWYYYYEKHGSGGLLAESMNKWHGGGKFLVVLMFISLLTNMSMSVYSMGLSIQAFGRFFEQLPRFILVLTGSAIYYVLAMVGRSKLAEIVGNFLPMIAYWSLIYFAVLLVETSWFRRRLENEYRWKLWNYRPHFPIMYAAIFSFCCGVAGIVVGMNQTYYVGVLAKKVGRDGADLGTFLSFAFTVIAYIPSRALEIKLRHEKPITP